VNYPIPSGETGIKYGVSGPDGNIWFAGNASGYNNFVKVTTSGSATVYPLPSNALPCCEPQMDNLIVGPDSQLYTFLDEQQLGRITTADVFSEFAAWVIGLPWNQQYTPMGNGPDGAIWFTMGFTGDCHPQVGRATTSGVFAIFWLPVCAPIPGTIEPAPNAFVTGADKNLWYTRDAYVGKITI
jgi:streptogramin lyase